MTDGTAHGTIDLLVRGGRVIDGTGSPWRHGDVLVQAGHVVDVLAPGQFTGRAASVLDVDGLAVAPGFVDIHAHSDLAVIVEPQAEAKLLQGVTTEIVGNCGISVVPAAEDRRAECEEHARPVLGFADLPWDWTDVDSYLARVARASPAVNVGTYVGLGAVRCSVSGFDAGTPTPEQRRRMVELTREALRQGAVGISSGLVYAPGSYASTDEIVELVAEAAHVGALYSSHMRDQGDGFLTSVQETLDVGRSTGAPVQIAHHKVVGPQNWGSVATSLAMLDQARAEGVEAGSDVYPYLAGSTTMTALLPDWVLSGGRAAMLARLVDPEQRARIKQDWVQGRPRWDNRVATLGWANIYVSHVVTERNQHLVGLSVAEGARLHSRDAPEDFLLDLLVEEGGDVSNLQVACAEDDLRQVMSDPSTTFGSDGLFVGGRPHPRLHGTFPRILGTYVRELGVLRLEEAVRKMTSQPARRLGLSRVGLVEPGYHADLVVFDPTTVASPATYDRPTVPPVGVRHVIVSGRTAVHDGRPTGVRAGRVLRRSQPPPDLVHHQPRRHEESHANA